MSVVVGVDIGSSAARAVALDRDGVVLAETSTRYTGIKSWAVGHADPQSWLRALKDSLSKLTEQIPAASRPEAVGVGGQSPATACIGSEMALTYRHPAGIEEGFESQHEAQRRLVEDNYPGATVGQSWDWALAQLGAPHTQGVWPGFSVLPGFGEPIGAGEISGVADGEWGVVAGTPLVPGAPDALMACWAAGLDVPGRACDPGGRTGGLFVATRSTVELPAGIFSMESAADGVVVLGGPVSAHGRALEWLSMITSRPIGTLLKLAEESPPGANGVMFLPYLTGERTPRWRSDLRGEFVGILSDTGPGDLARAVLEGTAYGLAHIAQLLRDTGVSIDVLTSTGSPSKSSLWCSIKASVLEVVVERSSFTEFAAFGAGLAAGAGAGWWPAPGTAGEGAWPRPAMSVVSPEPDPVYRAGLEHFIELGNQAERNIS